MSEIAKRISAVANAGLWPVLQKAGFRKRAHNYHRSTGDALQVVTLQSSQWNHGDAGRFRINFGVHFATLAATLGLPAMPPIPKEPYCVLRAVWSVPDRWWEVDSTTNVATISEALAGYVRAIVWPWLESNQSLREAASTLERQPNGIGLWSAAAARLLLGERDEAERLITACIYLSETSSSGAAHLQRLRLWAAKNHLPADRPLG